MKKHTHSQNHTSTNVLKSLAALPERRARCLEAAASATYPPRSVYGSHIYGVPAIARLALGRDITEANEQLREVAQWFDIPHPTGRDPLGECDFVAIKLCLAWLHPNVHAQLDDDTRTAIRRFFLTQPLDSKYGSENHALIFRVSRYLMSREFANETFTIYNQIGATLHAEDRQWLDTFFRFRAQRGWGEFDSPCYMVPDWEAITCLFEYAPDAGLRHLARMTLDLLLADMAVDSLQGMYCGAHGRIYPPHALDHANEGTYPLQYLYFGVGDPGKGKDCVLDALLCSYQPHPLVADITLNRPDIYENRERKHLHEMSDTLPLTPLEGSIRKYTYYTPDYILGCVQFQDTYPHDHCGDEGYAHHQQHEWDFSVGARTNARIFTHHPGDFNEHNYWTGDLGCRCGHFFQQRTAVLALYDIPVGQPMQFIHAYVPQDAFDEIVEEAGTIFVRSGNVYAALTLPCGYNWVREGENANREVISNGPCNGAVCETGSAADFGSFAAFRTECLKNKIDFSPSEMRLTYHSCRAGKLTLDTRGTREIDGAPADLNYATYDCPYLRSEWKSGIIEMRHGENHLVFDFTKT